ncbi:MAG: hypothetical protein ACOH1Y_08515 [Propionicimonas sp.]
MLAPVILAGFVLGAPQPAGSIPASHGIDAAEASDLRDFLAGQLAGSVRSQTAAER